MTYPFVSSKYNYGKRKGPALGLMHHMAEGGNTVAYLHHNPARGVSVHFVCEYSGRFVQMTDLAMATGSLNPLATRTGNGPPPYGIDTFREVLGVWARDPNEAVISVEIEGFAKAGPNAAQAKALITWGDDMRSKLPTLTGNLGHRDQQDVKACPGALIDWASLGGHGLWPGALPNVPIGDPVGPQFSPQKQFIGKATVSVAGANVIRTADGVFVPMAVGKELDVYGTALIEDGKYVGQSGFLVYADGGQAGLLLTGLATFVPHVPPAPPPDCSAQDAQIATLTATLADREDRLHRITPLSTI